MYRIVLDTNVIVSAMINDGKPRQLLNKVIREDRCVLVTSDEMIREISDVLHRPKFGMDEDKIRKVLLLLVDSGDIRMVKSKFKAVRDPKDDMIINTAYDAGADYIVSGDADLLRLGAFKGISIVTVSEMLKTL